MTLSILSEKSKSDLYFCWFSCPFLELSQYQILLSHWKSIFLVSGSMLWGDEKTFSKFFLYFSWLLHFCLTRFISHYRAEHKLDTCIKFFDDFYNFWIISNWVLTAWIIFGIQAAWYNQTATGFVILATPFYSNIKAH